MGLLPRQKRGFFVGSVFPSLFLTMLVFIGELLCKMVQ